MPRDDVNIEAINIAGAEIALLMSVWTSAHDESHDQPLELMLLCPPPAKGNGA
jgi:hypothetical protein